MSAKKTVERPMTDKERAIAVLLELAETGTDPGVRIMAAEAVLRSGSRQPSLGQTLASQQQGAVR